MQWGWKNAISSTITNISLPLAYTANFSVTAIRNASKITSYFVIHVGTTLTTFGLGYTNSGNETSAGWHTIGY